MRRVRRSAMVWIGLSVAALGGAGFVLADAQVGQIGPGLGITSNGRTLHPVGRLTTVGNFPTGSALTPDGRRLWVLDCGHGSDDVKIVDLASGAVLQTLPLPGCYGGVAVAPDGRHAYVGGTPKGGSPTEGPTQGDQGDVIHVFGLSPAGTATESSPVTIPATTGGSGRTNSLPPQGSGAGTAFPEGLAISPDGHWLVTALNQADAAAVLNLQSGQIATVRTGTYPDGVVFDRRGRAFVSNEYDGTVTVIDAAHATSVATVAGLGGPAGDVNSHPEGMAVNPAGDRVYVAVTNRDRVAIIDTSALKVIGGIDVGRPEAPGTAPVRLSAAPDGRTLYAANSGEDAVTAISLTQRPPAGAPIISRRIAIPPNQRAITRYRTLARRAAHRRRGRTLRRALATLRRRYLRTRAARACRGPSPAQARRFVRQVLAALGRHDRRARRRALTRARRALPRRAACAAAPGYIPNLAPDRVIGRLPTAAYTTDVQVTPDGSQLVWLAGKGFGAGPNPTYPFDGDKRPGVTPANVPGSYVLDKLLGRVGSLPTPTDRQMQASTGLVDAEVHSAGGGARPADSPIPAPGGGPSSQIKHVFYFVKENRTYDQVFGSDPRGDGAPSLELFDDNGVGGPAGGITPNAHKLTRTFPLLDHFYADSEVSVDGHIITSSGYANDYVQKALAANYSNRSKGLDFGVYPVTNPPNDYLFDQAVKQGVSFRDYGEAVGSTPTDAGNRPGFSQVAANTDTSYPNNVFIGCLGAGGAVGNLAVCSQDSGNFDNTGPIPPIGAQSRFNEWLPQFQRQTSTGTVPTVNYFILPNDHTNGTTPNDYTPQALIADNDLALGQFVDAISHSSIWSSSAIFVTEDDSQDGADHVDAHRMPAFVISPWAKRGAVVHTRYDQYSMLHTIELITGLAPLSLNDALAAPMYDAFSSSADATGTMYNAVQPQQQPNQINGPRAATARESSHLPWDRIDAVPQAVSDQILWQAVHGTSSAPPPAGPNASPAEAQRAAGVRAILAHGGNPRSYLLGGRGGHDG